MDVSNEIDWDNAPEGTTHYMPECNGFSEVWIRDVTDVGYKYIRVDGRGGNIWNFTDPITFGELNGIIERPKAEAKPIYTQAMFDKGELPPIGSWFIDIELNDDGDNTPVLAIAHDLPLKRVVYKRGGTLIDTEYFGAVAHECKPILTKTPIEIAIDKHMESIGELFSPDDFKKYIAVAFEAGVNWNE